MAKSKIDVDRRGFLSLLKNGSIFCGKFKNMPIISDNVSFATRDGRIRIESTDNENTMRVYGTCSVLDGEDVSFCASPRDMMSVLSLIGDDTVTLHVDTEDKKQVTIMHSHGKSSLPCVSADDFPALPKSDGETRKVLFDAGLLQRWMSVALEFVDNGTLRPALTGVLVRSTDGVVGCAASDGHKLFRSEATIGVFDDFSVIVNASAARAVTKMQNDGKIEMKICGNTVTFSGENTTLVSRLIDANFPKVDSVIPQSPEHTMTCDRAELMDSVRRLLPSSSASSMLVVVHPENNILWMTSEDFDFNKSSEETVKCECTHGLASFGIKGTTFAQVLSCFDDEKCVIKKDSDSSRPVLIERTDADGGRDTYLIMPMLING